MSTLKKIKDGVIGFVKKEVVLSVAIVAMIITMFFVPVDKEYLEYFEYKTLIALFCMLAVVAGLKNTNIFLFNKVILLEKSNSEIYIHLKYVYMNRLKINM